MNPTTGDAAVTPGALRIRPPLLAGVLLLATLMLHLLADHPRVALHQLLGLILVAGGIGLAFFAAALFQARKTTKNPYGKPADFVTEMPYTFTRNPMYVGLATALLGCALFFGSIVMLAAPIIFVATIDWLIVPGEEATMARHFGESYLEYKQRVRRWL